jgi:YegS/Rv2252/BmrU family lipid kinase
MNNKRHILFIINPISGVGRKNKVPPLIEKHLNKDLFSWEIAYTKHRGHGGEIATERKNEFDAIVAVGGDGSVNEIGAALIGHSCALGVLPCGSGNGLARHLKIPLNLEKAVQQLAKFNCIKIDTGLINDQPFIGTCGVGFDAHIAEKFDHFGKRGFISYARLVMREFNQYEMPTFTISGDDLKIEKKALMCSVANSTEFGNGFTISPHSDIQDGVFELVFLEKFNWLESPVVASRFFQNSIHKSRHFSSEKFKHSIRIKVDDQNAFFYHVDGEPHEGKGEYVIQVRPKSLFVVI